MSAADSHRLWETAGVRPPAGPVPTALLLALLAACGGPRTTTGREATPTSGTVTIPTITPAVAGTTTVPPATATTAAVASSTSEGAATTTGRPPPPPPPPPATTTADPPPPGYPRICQAWNGIQNLPGLTEAERLARHDLAWTGTWDLGLRWATSEEQPYQGLATTLTDVDGDPGLPAAREVKAELLGLNPHIRTLVPLLYREAEYVADGSGLPWWEQGYYPTDSPFWIRDAGGELVPGWGEDSDGDGVIEADEVLSSLTDFRNADLIELVAQRALALERTGVVDGVFLDWWNEHDRTAASYLDWSTFHMTAEEEVEARLAILVRIRELVGDGFLILVNTNERTAPGSAPYVNGTFMELWKPDWSRGYSVEHLRTVEDTLFWASETLRKPRINCLEGWRVVYDYGNEAAQVAERDSAENRRWMRLFTTLALTHSDGHVVFGDDNAEPTWDHFHNWYGFWDADLGQPVGDKRQVLGDVDGLFARQFTNGWAVYNRSGKAQTLLLPTSTAAASTGLATDAHTVGNLDGEILLGPVTSGEPPVVLQPIPVAATSTTTPTTAPPASTTALAPTGTAPPATTTPATTTTSVAGLSISCSFDEATRSISCTASGTSGGSLRWTSSLGTGWSGGQAYERTLRWGEPATEATIRLEECTGDQCTGANTIVDLAREPSGDCPADFSGWFTTFPLPDLSAVYEVGPPFRILPDDYKGHGYFRVPHGQNLVDVRMPIDATLVNAAVYVEGGEPQYSFTFRTACEGLSFLFDHVRHPVSAITDLIDWEPTSSSAGRDVTPLTMAEGDLVGTSIGTIANGNAFLDFGVNDDFGRLPTPQHPNAYGRFLTAVCIYTFFEADTAAYLRANEHPASVFEEGLCP